MRISVKADIKAATRKLRGTQKKQIPYAVRRAINDTAFDVMKEEIRQTDMKFDRPTTFTRRAFKVQKVSKGISLNRMVASVFIQPIQSAYLHYQIFGGTRTPKNRAIPVPTKHLKLNRYGNMPKNKIKTLLANPKNFEGTIKGIGGIWQRTGGKKNPGVRLLIAWEPNAQYQKRFPFYKIGTGKARGVIGRHLRRNIDQALRTSK